MRLTPEQEAAYALDWRLSRDSLKPEVQAEYDRQLEARRSQDRGTRPDAIFPTLGVQVRGDAVEALGTPLGAAALGALSGAEARLTGGSQAWSPGRAVFLPVGMAGLATETKATAFVIFPDGKYHETAINGNTAMRAAQAEAVKFNLMASPPSRVGEKQDDVAAILRKLTSLHEEGLLTDEEFAAKRTEVIARI